MDSTLNVLENLNESSGRSQQGVLPDFLMVINYNSRRQVFVQIRFTINDWLWFPHHHRLVILILVS